MKNHAELELQLIRLEKLKKSLKMIYNKKNTYVLKSYLQ